MGFFDDFTNATDSILGIADRAGDIYQKFAGTGGNNNDGSLPVVIPTPAAQPSGMSTTTIVVLVAGAALIGYFLLRKR